MKIILYKWHKHQKVPEQNILLKYCEINPDMTAVKYDTIYSFTPGPRDSPHRAVSGSGTEHLDFESPGPVPDP